MARDSGNDILMLGLVGVAGYLLYNAWKKNQPIQVPSYSSGAGVTIPAGYTPTMTQTQQSASVIPPAAAPVPQLSTAQVGAYARAVPHQQTIQSAPDKPVLTKGTKALSGVGLGKLLYGKR
jgi:hypothetical protein